MATATGSYATTTLLKQMLLAAGATDTTDDTLLGLVCDRVNQYIETTTGRVIAPWSGTPVWTEDVQDSYVRRLYIGRGIRTITSVELAHFTGDTYTTLAATDYFARPTSDKLQPGWPYTELYLSDIPTSGFATFPKGFATVRITATAGWAAIPDDITELALTVATRAWFARQSGQQDTLGTDEMGRPIVSRFLSGRDRDTLRTYTIPGKLV
jgi:hypothetical protein